VFIHRPAVDSLILVEVPNSRVRYYPYGTDRPGSGTQSAATAYRFTGQRQEAALGLYDYGARFYDPALGRFISADTVVPELGNPQALNRYAYVLNNPLKYTDPTGHKYDPDEGATWQDTLRDHIVLVQGAISGGPDPTFWDPYLEAMKDQLLPRIGDYNSDGRVDGKDWTAWTTGRDPDNPERTYVQHVHYKAYGDFGTVEPGRVDLEGYVSRLSAGTGGTIYLFGHSARGGAVLAYVLTRSGAAVGHEVRAASLDGATDWVDTSNASAAYRIARKQGVTATTVSNQLDVGNPGCAHGQIGSIPHFAYSCRGDCGVDPRCIHALVVQHPNAGGNWDPRNTNLWITPFQWTMRELGL